MTDIPHDPTPAAGSDDESPEGPEGSRRTRGAPAAGSKLPLAIGIGAAVVVGLVVAAYFIGRGSQNDDLTAPTGERTVASLLSTAYADRLACGHAAAPLTEVVDKTCENITKVRTNQSAGGTTATTQSGPTTTVARRPELRNPLSDTSVGITQSVSAEQLVLDTEKGSVTVTLTPQTQVLRVDPGAPAQLAPGVRVLVDGDSGKSGARTALRVYLLPMDL